MTQDARESSEARDASSGKSSKAVDVIGSAAFHEDLLRLLAMRRDVRSFCTRPLPAGTVHRLIRSACLAPSVGYSQPWRFVTVRSASTRQAVGEEFAEQNRVASERYTGEDAAEYTRLKLAGLSEAPEHLAVFCVSDPEAGRGLGRQTMPRSVEYSVVAAIQNLWLVARAEGIGVGWVSILRPQAIADLLDIPTDWTLVAYLCLGYPRTNERRPLLEQVGWQHRLDVDDQVLER